MTGLLKIEATRHGLQQQLTNVSLTYVLKRANTYIEDNALEDFYVFFEEYQIFEDEDHMINRNITKLVKEFGKLHREEIH